MMMLRNLILAVAASLMLAGVPATAQDNDPENTLLMQLDSGTVTIRLRPDLAPNHVARAKELARAGFYDGTPFHRVIDGFMAQGGDPTGTGTGGSELPDLKAEFTNTNFGRGVIGAARTDDPDTANSQFFICFQDCSFLNGQYTVWGEVVDGMELVDKIKRGEPVQDPDRIVSMKVAADVN
jgi:peptidylprolyl isomerase